LLDPGSFGVAEVELSLFDPVKHHAPERLPLALSDPFTLALEQAFPLALHPALPLALHKALSPPPSLGRARALPCLVDLIVDLPLGRELLGGEGRQVCERERSAVRAVLRQALGDPRLLGRAAEEPCPALDPRLRRAPRELRELEEHVLHVARTLGAGGAL